jgi:hypothetical protein
LTHFHNWYDAHHKKDSTQTDSLRKYPVIFITAEGGASRTGAFTAMILSRLQDSYPGFRNDIYACSSVSGGSLGFSFFNALNYLDIADTPLKKDYYLNQTKEYFKKDFLSPVLAKMFYGEAFNTISFWDIPLFDRAIALEKSWEDGYHDLFKEKNAANIYAATWQSLYAKNPLAPAWFINTTEVETGQQCFISNVRQDSAQFFHRRDLLVEKIPGSINYSTAVNFSTRFPLISPSAAVEYQGKHLHYVDGGYAENSGSLTMLEVLRTLEKDDTFKRHVIPYVIQLRFGDKDEFGDTRFVNEINSIVSGLYNLRSGNCDRAVDDLQHFTEQTLKGVFMPVRLPASSKEVPLNWTLSRQSIDKYLDGYVDTIFRDPNQALHKLYWFKH